MSQFLIDSIRKYVSLSEEDITLLDEVLTIRKIKKKQWIITPGEVCKTEFFVNKGCFRSYFIDDNGHEHITKFATEGWWITDISSFYTGKPGHMYVEALEDGEVTPLRKEVLDTLADKIPQLNKYFKLVYQKGLANSCDRLLRTISSSATEHYLRFIEEYTDIEKRVPQYMIASYLGITPEFLSKAKMKISRTAS